VADCLRFLRLGLINILGITVPGILLLLFLSAGLLFPLTICVVSLCQRLIGSDACVSWEQVAPLSTLDKVLVLCLAVVLAYISGYILSFAKVM
jgi:hypothetical protein